MTDMTLEPPLTEDVRRLLALVLGFCAMLAGVGGVSRLL